MLFSSGLIAGSSLGGLVSLYLGLKRPDVFGKLLVVSPSLWWDNKVIIKRVKALKARPDLMARIAASTGGIELQAGTAAEIAAAFTAHLDRSRPERIRRITAWDRWWVMLGTLFVWTLAWGVRRNAGLV